MARQVVRTGFLGPGGWERIAWSGVFAGLVIAIVTTILLSVLGIAIGLTALSPAEGIAVDALGWGAAIWAILTVAVALCVGGYVAGRFAATTSGASGAMNGALVWGLSFIVMGYFVATGFGALMGGVFGVVGQTATMHPAQQAQMEQMARTMGIDVDRIEREVEQAAEAVGTAGTDPTPAQRAAAEEVTAYTAASAWLFLVGSILGLVIAGWAGARGHRDGALVLVEPRTA